MTLDKHSNRRVLIIDDNQNIHSDFKEVLASGNSQAADLAKATSEILGYTIESSDTEGFEIDSAFQGQEGLEMVRSAAEEGAKRLS